MTQRILGVGVRASSEWDRNWFGSALLRVSVVTALAARSNSRRLSTSLFKSNGAMLDRVV